MRICNIIERINLFNFTLFFGFKQSLPISIDLRPKNYNYPSSLKMVPIEE